MSDPVFSPQRLQEAMGGMSNVDLADRLGCARSSITMYLSGQRTPSKMTVQLMAICLGVSPAWLMGLDVAKHVEGAPAWEGGPGRNRVRIAGRDGRFVEKELSDGQIRALMTLVEQLPEVTDL